MSNELSSRSGFERSETWTFVMEILLESSKLFGATPWQTNIQRNLGKNWRPFERMCVCVSRSVVSDSVTRLLCPGNSPGKNTRVGCHSFSRGSSQARDWTWVSCIGRQILYHLSHQGSPFWKDEHAAWNVMLTPNFFTLLAFTSRTRVGV